ncbi:hypothetical protein ACFYP4_16570 [Streptomyces sp. NPDC005551]|uniref:hypothetical protein n=1 Tax=unclassified Streptomyces TaxID=2593676 RepID=UPI0033E39A03
MKVLRPVRQARVVVASLAATAAIGRDEGRLNAFREGLAIAATTEQAHRPEPVGAVFRAVLEATG